jgi:HEAT repeat protein
MRKCAAPAPWWAAPPPPQIQESIMKNITKRSFVVVMAAAVFAWGISPAPAGKVKTEEELIAALAGPNEDVVADAMLHLEKEHPSSAPAIAEIKKYLTDSREKVRRKAARVLGALHAEVSEAELKSITAMFKATDPQEVMDALKSLRGLKAGSVLPEILPLLQSADIGVIRDACRTVAVLGTKANIPAIEPLTTHADAKVQKDAKDAIFTLQSKS